MARWRAGEEGVETTGRGGTEHSEDWQGPREDWVEEGRVGDAKERVEREPLGTVQRRQRHDGHRQRLKSSLKRSESS